MSAARRCVALPFHGGRIWVSILGVDRPGPPLLCVPGGPGMPHDYLSPLEALADARPVVFFDPISTGRSSWLELPWSRALLVAQLRAVRASLGEAPVDIYVHSGAILGADELWTAPRRFRRVVLASTPFDMPAHTAAIQACIDALEPRFAAALRAGEADPPGPRTTAYAQAYDAFCARHVLRLRPLPPPMQRATLGFNRGILRAIKGGLLLHRGPCASWTMMAHLPALTMPVLVTCGRHDPFGPAAVAAAAAGLPDHEVVVFEGSSHMPHLEEPGPHLEAVRRFLAAGS